MACWRGWEEKQRLGDRTVEGPRQKERETARVRQTQKGHLWCLPFESVCPAPSRLCLCVISRKVNVSHGATAQTPTPSRLPTLRGAHTLGIKEAGHPERIGPPFKYPGRKLSVPFQELGEPEAQRGRVPGHSFPDLRYASVIHVVQGISQVLKQINCEKKNDPQKKEAASEISAHLTHNDRPFDGQFQVTQATAKYWDDFLHSVDFLSEKYVHWIKMPHLYQTSFHLKQSVPYSEEDF